MWVPVTVADRRAANNGEQQLGFGAKFSGYWDHQPPIII